jgi:PAS domain S-box-containing protein
LRSAVSILLPSRAQICLFWGPDLVAIYNDAYRPTLGVNHPWALGRPAREIFSGFWEDVLRPLLEGVLQTGEALWAADHPFALERHGFPEETYFDISYDPVRDETGNVGGVFCIVSETTGRVIGERRLRLLRDLGRAANEARTVTDVYAGAAGVLEGNAHDVPFAQLVDAQGKPIAGCRVAPREDWPAASAADGERVLQGADLARFAPLPGGPWPEPAHTAVVLPIATPGQAPHAFLVAGASPRLPFDDGYRDFLRLVAASIASGVAAARALEEQRAQAQALAAIDRAKTAFFSNVSHEFRTPLTLLLGPLEELLAQESARPPAERAALEVVHRNGQRLLRLVNTLLDFARIEAGRAQASYEPLDLASLTRELASNFRSACERAGLRLDVDCAPLDEPAYVDREMWEKIVLNLLSNAFKFTLEGGIAVGLRRRGAAFELSVRDTGTGIPQEALPRMFERFHRVEGAHGRSHEGSGIGLALVQELVKLHGGTIRVESRLGAGSVFTVSIPAGGGHLSPERIRAPRDATSTALRAGAFVDEAISWLPGDDEARAGKQGARRVLLADDNADLRGYARRLLSEHYEVEAVNDGEAALAAARARRPDLVVTDIMMPKLDGFGLMRALREDPALRDVPVLALSARAGEEARVEGLGKGADDYLVKPFSARELLVRAEALLRSQDMRRESSEALRASEERYRQVLRMMPAGVYTCEAPSGVISYYNEHAARLWGRTPRVGDTEERFCACYKVWSREGKFVPREQTPMAAAVREGASFRNVEAVVERPDGTRFTAVVNIDPIRDAGGRVIGAINVFYDITDRRRVEERLAAEMRALARLNEASSRLWRMEKLQDGLQEMLNATIELLGADMGNVQLLDGAVLRIAAQRGFASDFLDFFREVSTADDSACGRALRSGERMIIEDVETDAPYAPLREVARKAGYRGVQSTPLVARDGRPLGMISTHWRGAHRPDEQDLRRLDLYTRQAADFVERCAAEARLRRSEQALNDFFETASIGLDWVGPDGIILRVNPAELELLGYAKEEYVGRHIAEFHVDRAVIDDILARLTRGERLHEVPAQMRCKDGSVRDVLITSSVLFENGKFIHTRCFTQDVTERRRLEALLQCQKEALEMVARGAPLAEILEYLARTVETLSQGLMTAIHLLNADGTHFDSAVAPSLPPAYLQATKGLQVARGVGPCCDVVLKGESVASADVASDPRWPPFVAFAAACGIRSGWSTPIVSSQGRIVGTFANYYREPREPDPRDRRLPDMVTRTVALAVEHRQAEDALRESDRRKDEFIAMLSHELRNPLAPLRSGLELMRLKGADAQVHAMLERQVGHLARLVDDLLEASRISRGLLEIKREPLDLGEVVRGAVESAEPVIREGGHRLEVELPQEPLWIEGDRVRLAQSFGNLLNNAARYTPRGGRIWLRADDGGDGRVRVSVRDTGAGFSAETKQRLFQMFSRGAASSGLGIGLALVRKLVEMHGGTIEAASEGEGRGAEFTVTLPAAAASAARSVQPVRTSAMGSLRVLVADDNRDAAESMAALLRALGGEVNVAYDGVEAVEAARAFRPDVILLDIGMPRLDGYGAARAIRREFDGRGVKIVALTGWGQEGDRRLTRDAGFDNHLVKPAELEALRRVLDEARQAPAPAAQTES